MNFHISPFSPLRPQFSSGNLGSARSSHQLPSRPSSSHHQHDLVRHHSDRSSPVRIAVEPPPSGSDDGDDVMTSDTGVDDDTDSLSEGSAADDVTQDSRDVLVQRLNDLAEKLSTAASVRAASVEALHKQVDDMERTLRGAGSRDRSASRHSSSTRRDETDVRTGFGSRRRRRRKGSLQLPPGGESPRGRDNSSLGIMAPMSPSWFMSRFQQQGRPSTAGREGPAAAVQNSQSLPVPSEITTSRQQRPPVERLDSADAGTSTTPPRISSEVAETVVMEAEKLCSEMATVIESLRVRREESDHLHAVLIKREEMANQRLLDSTTAISRLEDVVADHEAELKHLRLELRAIEVRCMGYVPEGADPELDRSIRNWKDDWRNLRERFAARRGSSSFVSGDEDSSMLSTLAATPSSMTMS
ncbi:hypothetical protein M406DRAFT_356082 [Cryphonectria parasitica EP155]|uniref:Uncharacterized protein n=1 Tax=Cryphonectria parasitica (strain ATCC 38755 / EP155) TaxID=660469 RepID=A0A9P5CQA7_CRYP1|nr:uncharacterized protein M406DRAFT_356082 [Cryphonectria parasitica EP155]KAF3765845.1 hypothetical protein M406DRAFT_356082 [Cryphonectria parasitica EP155]